jgi:carbonic anhydrase
MAIHDLLQNNANYARSFELGGLPARPARRIAVLTCMDARIDVHRILGLKEGDAHVIRNAGGLLTLDAVRSLVLSQRVLSTEETVVIQHTGCGMLNLREAELEREIEQELGVKPSFEFGGFTDLYENVKATVAEIEDEALLRGDAFGFIYDITTGLLQEVS